MNFAKSGSDALVINWRLKEWFPDLSEPLLLKFKRYHEELLLWNKKTPLINVKNISSADQVFFGDSIVAGKKILEACSGSDVYDFGSGNGFPGIVMALLDSKTKIYLVDNDPKKAEFLNHVKKTLELGNLTVLLKNIENLPDATVQNAVCRDFFGISKTILSARKCFKTGGSLYHIKGDEWASEVMSIPSQLCTFWKPELFAEYKLPGAEIKKFIVKTLKTQS